MGKDRVPSHRNSGAPEEISIGKRRGRPGVRSSLEARKNKLQDLRSDWPFGQVGSAPSRSASRQQKIIITPSSLTLTSWISILPVWLEFAGNAELVGPRKLEPGPND
jgi:hypothetical protein